MQASSRIQSCSCKENFFQITERKRREQLAPQMRAVQFGITTPEEVFLKLSELFACAQWNIIESAEGGFTAQSCACKLRAIARSIGAPSPCHLYCLDPMEGLVKAVKPDAVYTVKETLWDGSRCEISVT